jgi:hypothetical protein
MAAFIFCFEGLSAADFSELDDFVNLSAVKMIYNSFKLKVISMSAPWASDFSFYSRKNLSFLLSLASSYRLRAPPWFEEFPDSCTCSVLFAMVYAFRLLPKFAEL